MDAADWDKRYSDSELVWGAPPNRYVVQHATSLPAGRALDLACGEGRNALWLATRGWQVTGLDYSAVALRKAEEIASRAPRAVISRLTWEQGDVTTANLGGGYNLVLMVYLHLPPEERRELIAKACAALALDGQLLVVAHDLINLTEGYGGPPEPAILFTPDDVLAELPEGMTSVTATREHREVETSEGARTAIDAVIVAKKLHT
ncbi:MAG: class I SAM-dependent methyltransferase [Mycobacteriaceae bacterium]